MTCTSATVCTACTANFWFLSNNTCSLCPNALACKTCTHDAATNVTTCNSCSDGFWMNMTTMLCMPCQAWCKTCTNSTWCTVPFSTFGVTLVETMLGMNDQAGCDDSCLFCSTSYPEVCRTCFLGFYMVTGQTYCMPCTATSHCQNCNPSNPAQCYNCWSDSFLASDGTCQKCQFPCSSCTNSVATTCSSCVQGYVLIGSTCVLAANVTNAVTNCANQQATSATAATVTCDLCLQGFAPTPAGCVPCSEGCLVCNPADLITCTKCMGGWYLNGSNICVN